MDPYEEVAQQGQIHPLSPAYVPDPIELDKLVPVYVSEPEHPEYHAPLDDDIQVEDNDDDLEKDPSEEHEPEDDDEDPDEEHEPEDSEEIEPFEEDEIVVTPPPPRHERARISVRPQTHMASSTQALIDAFAAGSSPFPLPPTNPAYDQPPLGHKAAMIHRRDDIPKEDMPPQRRFAFTAPPPGCDIAESSAAAARAPRSQYDFVDTIKAGQGLIRSLGHDTRTIARAADRAKDVGYVRALQASERMIMTSIEEVNLRTDRRDIGLEIDAVRGQRTAYETELQEVHQAYLSSEAQKRALLARLEMLETHMSHIEWQRQSAEDLAVTQMMCIHTLEARARTDKVEDTLGRIFIFCTKSMMTVIRQGTNDAMTPESIQAMIDQAIQRNSTHTQDDASQSSSGGLRRHVQPARYSTLAIMPLTIKVKGNDVAAYTQCFQELALIPKTLDEAIELANDLMDHKLPTYAERQNENKRKTDKSSRNSQQQQPHKRQNIARAYTAGPGEKKCRKCKRYGHTTTDCRVNANNNNNNNNNNRNQKAEACYEYGNIGHIKRNCPKLKNHGNGNGNGIAQGRAYALGGRDASPDTNVITGTFLLNNRYAKILFDTGANRSFVSTTFSALINITPTTLENHYDVELADGKIIRVNTIIQGCTLNFMNHPFNIDLIPVPLGSFDIIIGMDWLTKY
nr:hypothetical protein [Tanacetum cinerariifolium]